MLPSVSRARVLLLGGVVWVMACQREPSSRPAGPRTVPAETAARRLLATAASRASLHGEVGKPLAGGSSGPAIPHLDRRKLRLTYRAPAQQSVACGPLGFARLLPHGFEGFGYQPLARVWRRDKGEFTHVVIQEGFSYLLLGPNQSLQYYQANTRLTPYGRVPALGPFEAWADARRPDWVWMHYLKDDAVHRFELGPEGSTAALQSTVLLPRFDGQSVARLSAGQWLYSRTTEGSDELGAWALANGGHVEGRFDFPPGIFAVTRARRTDRAWALSEHGSVWLLDLQNETTALALPQLSGSPYAADAQGRRLAVVSYRSEEDDRLWAVEVTDEQGHRFQVELPKRPRPGSSLELETADRDVCLVPQRPWVVVGGSTSLAVIDYQRSQILLQSAEE